MIKVSKVITISSLSATILLAVSPTIPNSSTIQKQIEAPKDIPIHQKDKIELETPIHDILKKDDSTKKIFIKDFKFIGNSIFDSKYLKALVKDYSNKELTFKQIQEVLQIVTNLYRDKGYFVARAYLPPQDIVKNDDFLDISIVEGKYGEIILDNKSLVKTSYLDNILDKNLKTKEIINTKDIERALLLINQRNGVNINKTSIEPGNKTGTGNLNIPAEQTKRVNGYVVADNYGSRYTGYNRLQALLNINSPFNIGDRLTISGLISNGADLKNGRLAYELPLNSYGLKADFAYSRTNYNLIEEYKDLDANGNSNIYEVGLSYPIILLNEYSFWTRVKYFHKDLNDYIFDKKSADKNIDSLEGSLDFDKNYYIGYFPAKFSSNLNLTTGYLNSKLDENSGRYNKIDTHISNDILFSDVLSLNTTLTAQKVLGHKNLDGSEDLSLGGAYGVKLYPYSEQNGDNGYVINFELLTKLPSIFAYTHKFGLFYDIGDVYQEINSDSAFQRTTLKDIGIGYYVNYKDFFARTQMAWSANSKPITSEYSNHKNSKFLVQLGTVF